MQNQAVQILTAGFRGQQNHITKDDQTAFTQSLLEGIKGNAYSHDPSAINHKWIAIDELASWLQKKVSQQTQDTQFPQYERLDFGTRGSFVFLNPNSPFTDITKEIASDDDAAMSITDPIPIQVVVVFIPPFFQQGLRMSRLRAIKTPSHLDNQFVELEIERKSILSTLKNSQTHLQIRLEYAKNLTDLKKLIGLNNFGILHLSDFSESQQGSDDSNGNEENIICFSIEDEMGQVFQVHLQTLAQLLTENSNPPKLVVIDSPKAKVIAQVFLKAGVEHVVGITHATLAANFVASLYKSLLNDHLSVSQSFANASSTSVSADSFFIFSRQDGKSQKELLWQSVPSGAMEFLNPPQRTNLPKVGEVFVGRNEEVKAILGAITHQRIVSVTGGPGVGKTATCLVASNFLNCCRYFCDGAYFVDLSNLHPAAVFFKVGSIFGLSVNSEDELLAELTEKDCLLLLDNCDHLLYHEKNLEFRKFLSKILCQTRYVKLLVTSRQDLDISVENEVIFQPFTIKISELSAAESSYLVSKIAPSLGECAKRVGEIFGHLPLAIHAAKIFVNQESSKKTPTQIVQVLEKQVNQMQSLQFDEFQLVNLSIESSYSTLPLELQNHLLCISVFPSTFEVDAASHILDTSTNECKSILRKLLLFNLISSEQQNRYHLHGLIRMFLKKKCQNWEEKQVKLWNTRYMEFYMKLLQLANSDYVLGNEAGLKIFDQERHNVEAAMQMAQETNEEIFCTFALAGDHIFCARISVAERIAIYDKCVTISKRTNNRINEASFLCSLAFGFERSGEYARAESLYLESLKIRETNLNKYHPALAEVLKDLALLYSNTLYKQDFKTAGKYFTQALEIREKALGKDHPETAKSLSHLANFYRAQKQYGKAESLYERSLQILKTLGTENIYVARVLNNQGQLYSFTNREKEAEMKFLQAIQITRKLVHPDRSQPLCNLGILYRKQKKFIMAEMLFKEALQVRELSKETFACSQLFYQLGQNAVDQKKHHDAELYLKKALQINDIYLGRNHRFFISTLQDIEDLYRSQGKDEEAEELLKYWGMKKNIHSHRRSSGSPSPSNPRRPLSKSEKRQRPPKKPRSDEL